VIEGDFPVIEGDIDDSQQSDDEVSRFDADTNALGSSPERDDAASAVSLFSAVLPVTELLLIAGEGAEVDKGFQCDDFPLSASAGDNAAVSRI